MERGIRQGCPVSALLFIFVVEFLAIQIRKNHEIHGLKFNENIDREYKIHVVQHADDCTNMVKEPNSLKNALETIQQFSKVAGPNLNIEKTECILTGKFIKTYETETVIEGVKINRKSIKSLGIYLGHDKDECYNKNWTSKLENFSRILSVWKIRNLTIFGKCTIINTLAISKLVYNAFILQNPKPEYFKNVSKMIFNFIWKKRDRIKRNTLIGKIEKGGINIVDIESKFLAAKASWIKRITNKCSITYDSLNDMLHEMNISVFEIIKMTDTKICKILRLPIFYCEVFSTFYLCKKEKKYCNLKRDEILTEFIWCNSLFKYKGQTICFVNWIKDGILYVKDIFDENGEIYDISYFMNLLRKRNNILCEYVMLKQAMKNFSFQMQNM